MNDGERKNVGEAKRMNERKWTLVYRGRRKKPPYIHRSICNSLKRINFTKRESERMSKRNNSIFNSFQILDRKKAYACVMLSVDHPVVGSDGTSSLVHSSSGISVLTFSKDLSRSKACQ